MKINDTIEVRVEKLVYGGEGLCRWGDNNFVVFVADALPAETLRVKITALNKHFARGKIVDVIEASPGRTKPFCPLYNACGACKLQIAQYDYTAQLKNEILGEIFKNFEVRPIIKSPIIKGYRRKVQYPCRQTKNSKRVMLGYFKNKTHDITDIKFCPAQDPLIDEIAQFIRKNYDLGCYDEKTGKGLLKNVIFRLNKKGEVLAVFVLNLKKYEGQIDDFANILTDAFGQIKGIFANSNFEKTNKILGKTTLKIKGENCLIETLGDKKYKIGATSFFQVNPVAAEKLFHIVEENIAPDSTILDCYGGVGAIGIFAGAKARHITLIEENEEAINLALENYKLNGIQNFEIIKGDAAKCIEKAGKIYDCALIDPPRSGCDKKTLDVISKIAKKIIYISCNPETLKRDIEYLKGFIPKFIQGVDMFPYTHHIESVCVLEKIQ